MEAAEDLEKKVTAKMLGKACIPITGDIYYHNLVKEHEMSQPAEGRIFRKMIYEAPFYVSKYFIYGSIVYELAKRFL